MLLKTGVGIELAGKDLRIAVLRTTFGKVRLDRSLVIEGFSELSPEEQKTSVVTLVKQHRIPHARVFLSLPRELGVVRQIEFPIEVREKLSAAIELQLETLSPWPVEDIYWDFAVEPAKHNSRLLSVTIAIISRTALAPWIDFFKNVKLPLSGASLSSLACAHGARSLWNDRVPTVVLGCETDYVEGSLIQGGRIHSITIKGSDAQLQAKSVIERLLSLSRLPSLESARLLAFGSAVDSLESVVSPALPIENAKSDGAGKFGAIAAALMGLKKSGFASNLIPRSLRYRRSQLQLIPTYILAALAILLGVALLLRESYQLMVYAGDIDREIQQVAPEVSEVASQEAELNGLSEKYRALSAHFQNRDLNLEALRELARALPDSAWVANYSYQDGNITLSGFAASGAEVQKVLEDSPVFKDVQFTSSLTREANGKDKFTLKAAIEAAR